MKKKQAIILTGLATFFFGFGASAILNLYLIAVNSPLIKDLRSSLSFKSSIYGDGIVLPIVNMIMVAFLYKKKEFVRKNTLIAGFFGGLLVTIYFYINQALQGLTNWTMPTPWHWNFLGLWHAIYMFSVASLITLFFIVWVLALRKQKKLYREVYFVTAGIIFFLLLLRFDYMDVSLRSLIPH